MALFIDDDGIFVVFVILADRAVDFDEEGLASAFPAVQRVEDRAAINEIGDGGARDVEAFNALYSQMDEVRFWLLAHSAEKPARPEGRCDDQPDAVLFLGDYIYESIAIQLLRKVRDEPTNDIDTLDEYRSKYRLYRGDPDIQAAHSAHPLVPIWDDHEIVNDYDRTVFTTDATRAAAA